MQLNKDAFIALLMAQFSGNYNQCGRELGVSPAQVRRIVNGRHQAGIVFLGKLVSYYQQHGIDYSRLVFSQ